MQLPHVHQRSASKHNLAFKKIRFHLPIVPYLRTLHSISFDSGANLLCPLGRFPCTLPHAGRLRQWLRLGLGQLVRWSLHWWHAAQARFGQAWQNDRRSLGSPVQNVLLLSTQNNYIFTANKTHTPVSYTFFFFPPFNPRGRSLDHQFLPFLFLS